MLIAGEVTTDGRRVEYAPNSQFDTSTTGVSSVTLAADEWVEWHYDSMHTRVIGCTIHKNKKTFESIVTLALQKGREDRDALADFIRPSSRALNISFKK